MPTPKERNALIFLAALGAIGIGARAFRGPVSAGSASTAATRAALDRQIVAVDSAKSAARTAPTKRSKGRRGSPSGAAADSAGGARPAERLSPPQRRTAGQGSARRGPARTDTSVTDPLSMYEARRLRVAQLNEAVQARIDRDRATPPMAPRAPDHRGSGRGKKSVKIRPVPSGAIRP